MSDRALMNRDLVLHLERLLDQAKSGEVQFLVVSAGVMPMRDLQAWGSLNVEVFSAMGSLVPRLAEDSLRQGYARTLEGLQQACGSLDESVRDLLQRFDTEPLK